MKNRNALCAVKFNKERGAIEIIDQTLLPAQIKTLLLESDEAVFDAIKTLKVRGAPNIGICAAFAIAQSAGRYEGDANGFAQYISEKSYYFSSSRPTAVNLDNALKRMLRVFSENIGAGTEAAKSALFSEADAIYREDAQMCAKMAEYGLKLVKSGDGILTHCNAGELAASRYGTALGPLLLGSERGYEFRVFCDETRPLLQGARLTMTELMNAGIDCTLICDNMASFVMKSGLVNAIFVGCDRVAANGDTANKIGTSSVAVLAQYYKIPFYVFCPSTTIDFSTENGDGIIIEQRSSYEITDLHYVKSMAPSGAKCLNPAFDVTPAGLIGAIITEKGICRPPYKNSLAALFNTDDD